MTCEQFVFWLSGYFTGGRDNDKDVIIEDIKTALATVKNPQIHQLGNYAVFHNEE